MGIAILTLLGGFLILTVGAEALVRGSSSLALKMGVTPLVIGLTIVSIGTSSPELAVSVKASLEGNGGIALGNVVGSNIANIGLILGISALISPMQIHAQVIRREIPILIGVTLIMLAMMFDGEFQFYDGAILFVGMLLYIWYNFKQAKTDSSAATETEEITDQTVPGKSLKTPISVLMVLVGLAMLIGGGSLFVDGAVDLATLIGISPAIIGLTIVAIGTSMPELATSVVASLKKEGDLAIGNAVGSNVFNILAILSVACMVSPISTADFKLEDFGVMLLYTLLLLPLAWTGSVLSRKEGLLLLGGYVAYLIYLVMTAA